MKKVFGVWYESKRFDDDYGVECVCENEKIAEAICKAKNLKYEEFEFSVVSELRLYEGDDFADLDNMEMKDGIYI